MMLPAILIPTIVLTIAAPQTDYVLNTAAGSPTYLANVVGYVNSPVSGSAGDALRLGLAATWHAAHAVYPFITINQKSTITGWTGAAGSAGTGGTGGHGGD